MAIFQVHCDESGKLHDSACVVFAAFVFPEDEVSGFIYRWNELLANADVKFLHMKDAMGFRNEFKGWATRTPDRDGLLEALGSLALARASWLSAFPMDTEIFKELSHADRKRLKDPLYAGFEGMLKTIVDDAARNQKPEHKFHMVYDIAEEYSTTCLAIFNKLRMMRTAYRQFFPSITFADDEQFPPLQAADMAAYCRKEQFRRGKCDGIVGRLLEIYGSYGPGEEGAVFYPRGGSLGDAEVE